MKCPLNRGGLRYFLVLLALAACRSTPVSILLGFPLVFCGAAVHLWAKGCLHQNLEVTMVGPYRFVRHPFYVANALIDFGIAVMSGWWPLPVLLPVWWLSVYIPVIRGEEAYLTGRFPVEYPPYKSRVSMLLPLRAPVPASGGGFSFSNVNIAAGTEIPRLLRLMAYPLAFLTWYQVRACGGAFFTDVYCLNLWVLATLVSTYVLAWQIKRNLVSARRILPSFLPPSLVRIAAVLSCVIAGALVTNLETEYEPVVIGMGGAVLALSLLVCRKWKKQALLAEGLALLGTVILCELMWLTIVPVVIYAALILDARLQESPVSPQPGAVSLLPRVASAAFPYAVVFAGLLVAVIKEVIMG